MGKYTSKLYDILRHDVELGNILTAVELGIITEMVGMGWILEVLKERYDDSKP